MKKAWSIQFATHHVLATLPSKTTPPSTVNVWRWCGPPTISFTLVTDHKPLQWLMTTQKLTGKMARWSLLLQEYDFGVQHRAGVDNTNADSLSRFPLVSAEYASILDWSRGEIPTYLTVMAALGATTPTKEEKDI